MSNKTKSPPNTPDSYWPRPVKSKPSSFQSKDHDEMLRLAVEMVDHQRQKRQEIDALHRSGIPARYATHSSGNTTAVDVCATEQVHSMPDATRMATPPEPKDENKLREALEEYKAKLEASGRMSDERVAEELGEILNASP